MDLTQLLGGQPDYLNQLLTPEQLAQARERAGSAAFMGGLAQLLGATGPQARPVGTGQAIGQALLGGMQGYQGSFDRTLQDMLRSTQLKDMAEKQAREKKFREQVSVAFTARPVGTGLSATGQGSQAQMLDEQIKDFGDEGMASTLGALQSNVNLPQEKVLDQRKFMAALAEYSPVEYAKMTMTGEKAPDAIRTFEAFSNMNPEQQKQFLAFKQSGTPQTNISLGERITDKIVGERVGEFSSAAGSARRFASDARNISQILKGKGGGEIVKLGTALAKDLGFSNESVTAQDLANSISTRGATTMRAPGSGSTSDIEFKAYVAAFPSLSNSEAGRDFMAEAADKFAERAAKLADYSMKLSREGKYSEEAIANFDKQLGSVLDLTKLESLTKATQQNSGRRSY
jgi:hypothetical protein